MLIPIVYSNGEQVSRKILSDRRGGKALYTILLKWKELKRGFFNSKLFSASLLTKWKSEYLLQNTQQYVFILSL